MRSFRLLVLLGVLARSASAQPMPYTEADYWQDFARLMTLLGEEESLLVGAGGGYADGGLATVDIAYRRDNVHSLWDLLPTTLGASVWMRPGTEDVASLSSSLGWTVGLDLWGGPYVTTNAIAVWSPRSASLEAGFDIGLGYELRTSPRWSVSVDARATRLWAVGAGDSNEPWGGRASVFVRRYLGDVDEPPPRVVHPLRAAWRL